MLSQWLITSTAPNTFLALFRACNSQNCSAAYLNKHITRTSACNANDIEWLLEGCILVIEPRTMSRPDYIPDCVVLYHVLLRHVLLYTSCSVKQSCSCLAFLCSADDDAFSSDESLRSNITHGGQHGDSSVLQLGLTTSLEVLNAAIRSETSRIPKPHIQVTLWPNTNSPSRKKHITSAEGHLLQNWHTTEKIYYDQGTNMPRYYFNISQHMYTKHN